MTVSAESVPQERIAAVRRFNRFYTQRIGVLQGAWLGSPFSLTEARVLYELKQRAGTTATEIARELGLDAGYLSRILRRFQKLRLIKKETSPADARQSFLTLTEHGRKAFAPLETRSNRDVAAMLAKLPAVQQDDLVDALRMAEGLMSEAGRGRADVALRAPRAGDFGWIVQRHAVLYQREYGWCEEFEGVCAQIVADFIKKFDSRWERGWIAELNGQNVGSVLMAKDSDEVARLRLLLVEPAARGLGVGKRLTDECIRFARECGYRRMTLWTHSVLSAARHVYAQAGFRLTSSEPRRSFGQDVVSEHWDMKL
jgi:DNA-binding MarR family transcriptional regulator/N-acetylglutamate synthase-like GNAT family acetyltransferase